MYVVLGSASGTFPGCQFAGFTVPLNIDGYTATTAQGGPPLISGIGVLSASGQAGAAFVLPPLPVVFAGFEFQHAFIAVDGSNTLQHASNAVPVRLWL